MLITERCPTCGADVPLRIDDNQQFFFCPSCNNEIPVDYLTIALAACEEYDKSFGPDEYFDSH